MLVYFMLSEKNGDIYQYHYSRETQEYDGLIEYNSVNKKHTLLRPLVLMQEALYRKASQ